MAEPAGALRRRQSEACIAARADYQRLAAGGAGAELLDAAKELDRAENLKARILAEIDRLDARVFAVD